MSDLPSVLDVKGLKCPLPVLKLQKFIKGIGSGSLVEVQSTDPLSVIDVPHFCSEHGHTLVETRSEDAVHFFTIRKKQ